MFDIKEKACAAVGSGSPGTKLYNSQSIVKSITKQEKDTTNLAGKFCHPDLHAKSSVEIRKIVDHILRIKAIIVRGHVSKLAKKF